MNRWPLVVLLGCALTVLLTGCEGDAPTVAVDGSLGTSMDGTPGDAQSTDSGPATDAGVVDQTWSDGAPADAETIDPGDPDAGLRDAEPVDIELIDAQPADARAPDARAPDAHPLDGGLPDAGADIDGAPCQAPPEPAAPCNDLPPDVDHHALYGGLDLDTLDAAGPGAPPCSPEEVESAFDGGGDRLDLTCSLTFPEGAVLRKNIRLRGDAASGVTIDCNGGRIEPAEPDRYVVRIQSREEDGVWTRPSGVRLVDCHIVGAVRILGLGRNGEADGVRLSSYEADHTARAQQIAPTDVLFLRVHIESTGTIPFYVAPGGTHIKLIDSRLSGVSSSTAIYLDAESAFNVIQNTLIETITAIEREVLAIDGSAHNLIAGNVFTSLHRGGVYVYRNCGEGGTVRHQRPRFNRIVGNAFSYEGVVGAFNPAVWLGTREGIRAYCPDDAGYPFGSSVSDLDYADFNLVVGNRIQGRDPADHIWDNGDGNRIDDNRQVADRQPGPTPCGFFDTCVHHVVPDGRCLSWAGEEFLCADGHLVPR